MNQVICHKCRCPNHFGTVFCRNCGSKLRVQDISHPRYAWRGKVKNAFRKLFRLTVVMAIILFIAGLFAPWGLPKESSVTEQEAILETQKKCEQIDIALAKKKLLSLSFTPEQLTYAANYLISDRPPVKIPVTGGARAPVRDASNPFDTNKSDLGGSSLGKRKSLGLSSLSYKARPKEPDFGNAPKANPDQPRKTAKQKKEEEEKEKKDAVTVNYSFSVDDKLNLHIVLTGMLIEYVPYRFELVGVPEFIQPDKKDADKKDADKKDADKKDADKKSGEVKEGLAFELKSARFGRIPMPLALKNYIYSLFKEMAFYKDDNKAKNYFSNIVDVIVKSENEVEVVIQPNK